MADDDDHESVLRLPTKELVYYHPSKSGATYDSLIAAYVGDNKEENRIFIGAQTERSAIIDVFIQVHKNDLPELILHLQALQHGFDAT